MADPNATIADVDDELPADHGLSASYLDLKLRQAAITVSRRIPDETDADHLTLLEALVAADFVFPRLTDADQGKVVESWELADGRESYSVPDAGSDSPYWQQAVRMDQRLANEPVDFAFEAL